MHTDTIAPAEHDLLLLRQSLNLLVQAIHDDPRSTSRKDLQTLAAVTSGLLGEEPACWQTLSLRSGLTEEELRASMRRLRRGGHLTPRADEDFRLRCSTPGEPSVMMSTLQSMARRGDLRFRAFGEEKSFALGVPHFGDIEDAVSMLPRLLLKGLFAVYRDETGFFLGPPNPAMIDFDPFADVPVDQPEVGHDE